MMTKELVEPGILQVRIHNVHLYLEGIARKTAVLRMQ
jgi:hypothetical protein